MAERGLDNPARALMRATGELVWTLLCLISDRVLFNEYCKANSQESARRTWSKLFGRGELARKINGLEAKLGVPTSYTQEAARIRKRRHEFYSQVVHHSFEAVNIGAYGVSFDSDEVQFGMLGVLSESSRKTLTDLARELEYFLFVFFAVIERNPEFSVDRLNDLWRDAEVFLVCASDLLRRIDT